MGLWDEMNRYSDSGGVFPGERLWQAHYPPTLPAGWWPAFFQVAGGLWRVPQRCRAGVGDGLRPVFSLLSAAGGNQYRTGVDRTRMSWAPCGGVLDATEETRAHFPASIIGEMKVVVMGGVVENGPADGHLLVLPFHYP